jgi:glycosyltransferase involved in cell wall biosynthesis
VSRVAIDATGVTGRATGAARAVRNLLLALPDADRRLGYVALTTGVGSHALDAAGVRVERRIVPVRSGLVWELRDAARAAEAAHADLLFTVRELVGRRRPPTVLHVFEPPSYRLRRPGRGELRSGLKDGVLAVAFGWSLRRARAVTAGSVTSAAWLVEHHGVDATVVLPGIEAEFFATGNSLPDPRSPYFLHLASADARDSTDLVVEAVERLGSGAPRLLIAGLGGDVPHTLRARVEALGWVSDEELRGLYRGALAYVHPSRYESYGGFAALEAMAAGTPVVAFDAPGVTEALADAALLVESRDADALATALRRVCDDVNLRARLAAAGRTRVEPLRWERAAAELARVFAGVLGLPQRDASTSA